MRYTSQGCNCSFSYDITCPQLKVPNQPTITCPAENAVLSNYTLNQCGNAIWAFGDTLAAVNGIVTGSDSALDAACTHNCCFTRCTPCVQFNLCTCPEVYDNPGLYSHRIRYVTASYEVSDFSEPGTFCIGLSCYDVCECDLNYNTNCVVTKCCTDGSCQAGRCIIFESSLDSDFSTIACQTTCSGSCIAGRGDVCFCMALNPDSNGDYLAVGSKIYTRVCTVGGYNCDETSVSPTRCQTVRGCLYTFALCAGVNRQNTDIEGCCCIQLYSVYMCDGGFNNISNQGICFKYEVSPFCDFCSDVTTACGPYNVYIGKGSLAGAGACSNYYVRTCVLSDSRVKVPSFVRCVNLGNVTYTRLCDDNNCWCNNPDCNYGRCCAGTINWDGKIALFEVGAGGVGSITVAQVCGCDIATCFNCSNCKNCQFYCCFWRCLRPGLSGCFQFCELEGLNGCCFFLNAANGNCVSLRSHECSYGNPSYMCVCGLGCYSTGTATTQGGTGATANPVVYLSCCGPLRCFSIVAHHGKSGMILCENDGHTCDTIKHTLYNGCCVRVDCACTTDKTCHLGVNGCGLFAQMGCTDDDIGYCFFNQWGSRMFGHACQTDISSMTCACTGSYSGFDEDDKTNCCCNGSYHGGGFPCVIQNIWGMGGFGQKTCVRDGAGLCNQGCMCAECGATQGFGYGAGGPAMNLSHAASGGTSSAMNNLFCSCGVMCWSYGPQAGIACCSTSQHVWNGNCCGAHGSYWSLATMPGGGSAGVLFLCNDYTWTHGDYGYWRGRPGLVAFACQDYA